MNDLKAFLDGELDAAASTTMQGRLQSDGSLAATARDFRRLSASFGALTDGPTVTGRDRALAAVSTPRTPAFNWRLAGAVASILLVTVGALNVFPIFAQSKEAAKRTAAMAESKRGEVLSGPQDLMGQSPHGGADTNASQMPGASSPKNEAYASPLSLAEPSSSALAEIFERKVVRTGRVDVRVKSIEEAEKEVTGYVEGVRGYVENTSSSNLDGKTPSMTMVVRIPQAKFSEALAGFEKLGERTAKDIQSSDVTQQIVDIEARLKNLRSQEETYRAILRTAKKVGEIIDVQQRLSAIRGEIESMQAQRDSMAKLAALSTITVTLSQRPPPEEAVSGGWLEDTWSSATYALGGAFKNLSVIGIWVLVYAPLWIPIGLLTVWGWRRALRA